MKTTLHQSERNLPDAVRHARNTKRWKIHLTDPVQFKKHDLFLIHGANWAVGDRGLTTTLHFKSQLICMTMRTHLEHLDNLWDL